MNYKIFLNTLCVIFLLFNPIFSFASVTFDGTDDRITTSTMGNFGQNLSTNTITLSTWVKSSTTDTGITLGGMENTGDNTFLKITLNKFPDGTTSSGGFRIFLRDDLDNSLVGGVAANTGVTDGNWHHVLVIVKGSDNTIKVFVDGVSQTITYSGQALTDNMSNFEQPWGIASFTDSSGNGNLFFNGTLEEYAIWNVEISDADKLNLAKAKVRRLPLQISSANLIKYLPLDDGADGTANCFNGSAGFLDMGVNGYHGTGDDGANNTGLTCNAGVVLTYP